MTTATLAPHRPAMGAIGAPAIALTGLTKTFGTVQADAPENDRLPLGVAGCPGSPALRLEVARELPQMS